MRSVWIVPMVISVVGASSLHAQSKPYVFDDIVTFLESGLSPTRVARRLDANCYDGAVTSAQVARLRSLGATTDLLDALRSKACTKAAPSGTAVTPAGVAPVPAAPAPAAPAPAAPVLLPLMLEPATVVLEQGAELLLQARVRENGALRAPGAVLTWLSTDSTVVSVVNGRLRAAMPGEAVVVVRGAGLQAATATVRVERGVASRVTVSAAQPVVRVGEIIGIEVEAVTAGGAKVSTMRPDCISAAACVTVNSSDTSIARVETSVEGRTLRGLRAGTVTVTAALPNGSSSQMQLRVSPPRIVEVRLEPETLVLAPGAQQRLDWVARGVAGVIDPQQITRPVWSASDDRVLLVQDGLVTALADGQAVITARFGDVESSAVRVTVRRNNKLAELRPVSDTVRGRPGDSLRIGVRGVGLDGRPFPLSDVAWDAGSLRRAPGATGAGSEAPINGDLTVVPAVAGTFTVVASSAGIRSNPVTVIVTEPPKAPQAKAPAVRPTLVTRSDSIRLTIRQRVLLNVDLVTSAGRDSVSAWSAQWSSSAPDIVALGTSSVSGSTASVPLTAVRPGVAKVTVTTDVAGSAQYTVVVTDTSPAAPVPSAPAPSSGTAIEERVLRAFADSLGVAIAERNSSFLSVLLAGSEPNAVRGFERTLRSIQGTPGVAVASLGREGTGDGEIILALRVTWRGSFGGESRLLRFALVTGPDGRLVARVRER